jgi:CubicO group peptidase (beta-lactamase class C family)
MRKRSAFFAVLLAALLAFAALGGAAGAQQRAAEPLAGFDEFVEQVREAWQIPGLAVAIVQDGKVIHARGYGYRDLERKLPVTPDTLFAIGSVTKSFTVTALGTLSEEGKFDWDKPVREWLPGFRLHDAMAAERMTPRDLVTHRSGLPRHDLLWYGSPLSRQEMFARLRYLEPSRDFRAAYQYQNLMFLTAGILAEQLSGMKWEELVRQRILEPLEMSRSNFSVAVSQRDENFSWPYAKVKDEVRRVPFRVIDEIGPAGSINSSVAEMSRYLLLHLGKGKYGEKTVVSEAFVAQMQMPQMVIQQPQTFEEVGHTSYGMGLFVTQYRGLKLVHHGGGIDGFIALISLLPQKNIGVVVLTNLSPNAAPPVITYSVFDRLLGLEPVNWLERVREQEKKQREAAEEARKRRLTPPQEGTRPSHALAAYAGEYEHPGYGLLVIGNSGETLTARFNSFTAPLEHFHFDVFQAPELPLNPLSEMKFTFAMDARGEIDRVSAPLETGVAEIVFTRKPKAEPLDAETLAALAGEYEIGAVTMTVAVRGETLTLTVPGQPTYELIRRGGLLFDIGNLSGFRAEFRRDATGAVVEMIAHQPNGSFPARRKP